MPNKARKLLAAAALLVLPSLAMAAGPTRREALDAIAVIERTVTGAEAADAAKTIVIYAQLSDDVVVNIGDGELPWLSEDWNLSKEKTQECQSMLVAAYVAGNVKSQLRSARAQDDTLAGWTLAIDAYRRLKSRMGFTSPSLEALSRMQSDGTLEQHAKELNEGQEDNSDAPKRPVAGLPARPTGT